MAGKLSPTRTSYPALRPRYNFRVGASESTRPSARPDVATLAMRRRQCMDPLAPAGQSVVMQFTNPVSSGLKRGKKPPQKT